MPIAVSKCTTVTCNKICQIIVYVTSDAPSDYFFNDSRAFKAIALVSIDKTQDSFTSVNYTDVTRYTSLLSRSMGLTSKFSGQGPFVCSEIFESPPL